MGKHRFVIDGQEFDVDVSAYDAAAGTAEVTVNGQRHRVSRAALAKASAVGGASARAPAGSAGARQVARIIARPSTTELRAPMAGRVLRVEATPGQQVQHGQRLLVLDAMKMENSLSAPADGTVAEVAVAVGDTVMQGSLLVRLQR